MKSAYPLRPLGEVLFPDLNPVSVRATEKYRIAGIFGFGRGVFEREPIMGSETKYPSLFRLQSGNLVYSKLKAFEGAIATATDNQAGAFVSPEFPIFKTTSELDTAYLSHICRWPLFWSAIAGNSKGIGARRERLHPRDLLTIEIPLPDIDEQRRVASHLNRVSKLTDVTSTRVAESPPKLYAFVEAAIQSVLETGLQSGWTHTALGSVAEINPRRARVDPEDEVTFVPMRALDDVTGRITDAEIKSASEIGKGYKQFCRGDVIFARITPCMQNGKSAVISGNLPDVGFGSTEFHVIRPGENVLAEWVHAIVRTRDFKLAAAQRFTGTAGQQRVPASFLESVKIPLPPTKEAQLKALENIGRINTYALELRRLSTHRVALAAAVLPSALNRAFAGLA